MKRLRKLARGRYTVLLLACGMSQGTGTHVETKAHLCERGLAEDLARAPNRTCSHLGLTCSTTRSVRPTFSANGGPVQAARFRRRRQNPAPRVGREVTVNPLRFMDIAG